MSEQSLIQVPLGGTQAIAVQNANDVNSLFSAGATASRLPRLSIRGGVFRYVVGGVEQNLNTRTLDVGFITARKVNNRTFYAGNYVPGQDAKPPDCGSTNGYAPDAKVPAPQAPSCAACPNNVWGSKITPTGKKARACGESKTLIVAPSNNVSEAAALTIPGTSLKNLDLYVKQLNAAGLSIQTVVTRLTFADSEFPMIQFTCVGYLTQEQVNTIAEVADSDAVQEAIAISAPATPQAPPVTIQSANAAATAHPSQQPVIIPPPVAPAQIPPVAPLVSAFGAPPAQFTPAVEVLQPVVTETAAPDGSAGNSNDLAAILANWSSK